MAHWTYVPAMEQGVFPHEGGYTNDSRDPGGPTNYGITIFDARKYWKPNATAADMKAMPKSVAEAIYWPHYAVPMRYDDLFAGVDYSIDDYGINSGIGRSGKVLRRVCDMPDNTWTVTDDVIAAVTKRDPLKIIDAVAEERLRFLKSLSTWDHFGPGWGRRVSEVHAMSTHFAKTSPAELPQAPKATPTQDGNTMAKGQVPQHPIVENKGAIATGASTTGAGWLAAAQHWVAAHPYEAAAIGLGTIAAGGAVIYTLEHFRKIKQEAPTPGLVPVPARAA